MKIRFTFIMPALVVATYAAHAVETPLVAYPEQHCHAISRKSTSEPIGAINSVTYGNDKVVSKWDIVCIGDTIRIDQPIRSNGGDIVVYADRLVLAAPLDTRVGRLLDGQPYYKNSTPEAANARFDSLVPPSSARFALMQYALTSFHISEARSPNKPSYELPPGETDVPLGSCDYTGTRLALMQGTTPPSWPADHFRSGNIHIYARDVVVEATAVRPVFQGDPLACAIPAPTSSPMPDCGPAAVDSLSKDAFEARCGALLRERQPLAEWGGQRGNIRPSLLIAQGLRGGRGGAGQIRQPYRAGCVATAWEDPAGLNGPGGDGGAAGSVFLYQIQLGNAEQPNWIREDLINTQGGVPGSKGKKRSPTAATVNSINFAAQPTICEVFTDEGEWPQAKAGASGKIIRQNVSPEAALVKLYELLAIQDTDGRHDLDELVKRGSNDKSVVAITFADFLERKLSSLLQAEQVSYIDNLVDYLFSDMPPQERYLKFMALDTALPVLQPLRRSLFGTLDELQRFQPLFGFSRIDAYFVRVGGVINVDSTTTREQLASQLQQIDSASQAAAVADIRQLLLDAVMSLSEMKGILQRAEYRTNAQALQDQISALEKAQSEQKLASAPALAKFAGGIGKLVGGMVSDNYAAVGEGMKQAYDGYQELSAAMQSDQSFSVLSEKSRKQLQEIQANALRLASDLANDRKRYMTDKAIVLNDKFDANLSLGARRAARLGLTRDLVKASLLTYYLDPARDAQLARQNLLAVRDLVAFQAGGVPNFSFRQLDTPCASTSALRSRCVTLESKDVAQVIRIRAPENRLLSLPSVVLAPRSGSVAVDTYNSFKQKGDVISIDFPQTTH